jgi:hypothetical protein
MSEFTNVGGELSVGADPTPDACAGYALVVLASVDHQHVGEKFPDEAEVLRARLRDFDLEPTLPEIQRATSAAERVAFCIAPWSIPYDLFRKFVPPGPMSSQPRTLKDVEPIIAKRALVCCESGMNRSLWIAGMALVLTGCQPTGEAALQHLKDLRGPEAFANKTMAKHLREYMPESLKAMRAPVAQDVASSGFLLRQA